jgi:hypothetical protein
MRYLILMWVALLFAQPVLAQERSGGTLTPAEIEAGWIRLFDGETLFGWDTTHGPNWKVTQGVLEATDLAAGITTTTAFGDFEFRGEVWAGRDGSGDVTLARSRQSPAKELPVVKFQYDKRRPEHWFSIRIVAEGKRVQAFVDGKKVPIVERIGAYPSRIALTHTSTGPVRYRNLKLRPLGAKSLFNGKDLTGWNVLPGHPSVYSVTPEGWLNVKNGGGDLQSTGQYGDFVLQLDIFSNGDHLNSGVFFRAIPGEFWSGYESQIRNQWEGEDRTKAVDFGTGGLYNLQAARRVVPKDREWFTMTVVATGLHVAIWVNGYQTVDHNDTRPAAESARNGSRTKAGVLSLQGHDPTTDLSFRNIRIGEIRY